MKHSPAAYRDVFELRADQACSGASDGIVFDVLPIPRYPRADVICVVQEGSQLSTLPRRLEPAIALSDVFPTGLRYNPRCSFRPYGWVSDDPLYHARNTGGALSVAGTMPTIAAAGAVRGALRELFQLAGVNFSPNVAVFENQHEYESLLQSAVDQKQKLVFHQCHAPEEWPDNLYWIPRSLQARLNNKANLGELVPAIHIPQRHLVPVRDLPRFAASNCTYPWVVKGASDAVGGGGSAVAFVHNQSDWSAVSEQLGNVELAVVEQFIDAQDNFCLNFFTQGNDSAYLGGSRQLTDTGQYRGNLFDPNSGPPQRAVDIGHEIMRRAIALGYVGVAGFDMLCDRQNRIWVVDLNFRLNGSTPSLMWQPVLLSRSSGLKARLINFYALDARSPQQSPRACIADFVKEGTLFPLALVTENRSHGPDPRLAFRGLAIGPTWNEVARIVATIQRRVGSPPVVPHFASARPPRRTPGLGAQS
ncbi:MAG: hypothetical protein KDA61_20225 [Planctomycetales bacterium]|nr:hypothetical protein [Planctomycetales bacterium]